MGIPFGWALLYIRWVAFDAVLDGCPACRGAVPHQAVSINGVWSGVVRVRF